LEDFLCCNLLFLKEHIQQIVHHWAKYSFLAAKMTGNSPETPCLTKSIFLMQSYRYCKHTRAIQETQKKKKICEVSFSGHEVIA